MARSLRHARSAARGRVTRATVALVLSGCGRVGVELLPHEVDGGSFYRGDGGSLDPDDGGPLDLGDGGPLDLGDGGPLDLGDGGPLDLGDGGPLDLGDGGSLYRGDGAVDASYPAQADSGVPPCDGGGCGTVCNLSGTWALKLQLAATWNSSSYLRAGSGTFTFWLKQQGTQVGNSMPTVVTDCGRLVPEFSATMVNETYLFGYPATLFDETPPRMPTAVATATLSAPSPGSSYRLPLSALLMGVTMTDPLNAAWPASAAGLTSVDSDMDGKPGVTAAYRSGGSYAYPYTGASLLADRADRPYAASRLVFSLDGMLDSCTRSTGAATVKFIDTRIFGCRVAGTTGDCSASQADFLDRNCVDYRLGAATYTLIKVPDAATCADVQAALP